jgi:hypothetical protein
MNAPFSITSLGQFAPGTGDVIDTTQLNDPAHQLSNIDCPVIEQDRPTCAFTFANHLPWNTDVFLYRYFTGVPGTAEEGFLSDLFVIQGYGGQNPDYIWFRSSDALTGDILLDGPTLLAGSTATRTNLGTVAENGDWQLAFDTGVDHYYIASAPEPATLALLGLGLAGLGFSRRKQ